MDTFHVVNAVPSKSNEQIETSNSTIGRSRSLEEDPGEKRGKRRGTSPIMRVHWEEGGSVALSAQASFLIRIFWVKSSRRGKISLSHFLSLVGSVLLEVWGYKGWKRGEIASCFVRGRPVSWPSGAPCRGNPLEPAQQFRTRLVHLLSPLLPNSPSFLSLAGGFPVRSSGQIRSRKDFLAANTLNEHQLGKLELERKVSIYGDGFVGIWVGCAWNIYFSSVSLIKAR